MFFVLFFFALGFTTRAAEATAVADAVLPRCAEDQASLSAGRRTTPVTRIFGRSMARKKRRL